MRERKSAPERRDEIITTAVALADAVGPERLTTTTIAGAIGLSQAAVFRHFPTKQSIWEAIIAWIGDRLEKRWQAAARPGATADAHLRALLIGHLELIAKIPAIPSILLSRELHSRNDILRQGLQSLMLRFHARLAAIVETGTREGSFHADLDAADAAYLAMGLVQGLVIRWSLGGRVLDLAGEGERMVTILLRGFQPCPPRVGTP